MKRTKNVEARCVCLGLFFSSVRAKERDRKTFTHSQKRNQIVDKKCCGVLGPRRQPSRCISLRKGHKNQLMEILSFAAYVPRIVCCATCVCVCFVRKWSNMCQPCIYRLGTYLDLVNMRSSFHRKKDAHRWVSLQNAKKQHVRMFVMH